MKFEKGQIRKSKNNPNLHVVVTSDHPAVRHFSGRVVNSDTDHHPVGKVSDLWTASYFRDLV